MNNTFSDWPGAITALITQIAPQMDVYCYFDGIFNMAMSEAAITEIHDEIKRRIDAYEKTHPPLSDTFIEFMLGKQNKPAP